MAGDREQIIAQALGEELARQGKTGIDVVALAAAVDAALTRQSEAPVAPEEGRSPDELNATNDD